MLWSPSGFRRWVSQAIQEPPSEFLPAAPGIQRSASRRTPCGRVVPAHGSSKPRGRAGVLCGVLGWCRGRFSPLAVGVYEVQPVAVAVRAAALLGIADPVFGDGFAGNAQPLFPFVGGLWLLVGVQQVVPAPGTATVLGLEQARGGAVQGWGWLSAAPGGPVVGQGRVIGCGVCR
jgi:hypothetical protein